MLTADQIIGMAGDVRQQQMMMQQQMNPFIELNPFIYKKLFQQNMNYTPALDYRNGLSGLTEAECGCAKKKKKLNIKNPDLRFDGTDSLVAIYRQGTPGQ